jgi:carboxyl-terminal processing protease
MQMDDEFSKELFKDYIESLDPRKRYFYQSDIENFKKFETNIDDQLKVFDITFFNVTYDKILQRIEETKIIYKDILSKPFDYTTDETFETDSDKISYVTNKKELIDRWRKELKFSNLSNYDNIYAEERSKKEKDPSYIMMSEADIEKEARQSTLKYMDSYFNDVIDDKSREDWFEGYVNTIVGEFDPHTYYLAPKSKEDFDQRMSGKLEGIGAVLNKNMDYIKIVQLVSGGPAWRSNELEVEDIILKVKQEHEDEALSIVGMPIKDAIKFIKGPKGTKVTLTIKKVDGTIKEITL